MSYKAIFFDFGGVFTASPFHAIVDFAIQQGTDSDLFAETLLGQYGVDGDHPWHRMERGEISLEDARQQIIDLGASKGFDADIYSVFASMGSKGGVKEKLTEFALTLRPAGYITVCVTNNVKEFGEGWRNLIPTSEIFDHIVDSCEEGVRKPDPKIYHTALERAGVSANEVLFLDDFEGNITAAQALGIDGLLVTENEEKTIADLQKALAI
tara:strand:- start:2035 stop:2667 length:633 start_codon:yes stop_codon:yes gene_type:complete